MSEQYIFIFGFFVVALFLVGVYITIREFQSIDAQKQKRYVEKSKDIHIKNKKG